MGLFQTKKPELQQRAALPSVTGPVVVSEDGPGHFEYTVDGDHRIHDLLYGFYGPSNFVTLAECIPELAAPINEIATRVASAAWQLRKDWNDEIDYTSSTYAEFNRLFSRPNPMQTIRDLVRQSVFYEITCGRQFFFKNIPSSLPNELASVVTWGNLPSNLTRVEVYDNYDFYTATSMSDIVRRYRVPQNGRDRVFDPKVILTMVNMSLRKGNDINCPAPLAKGAEMAIRNLIPVYEARGVIYIKRGAMGFIVSKKSDESGVRALTKTEKEEAQRDFNESAGLSYRKDTIKVTSVPVDWVQTSMSIKDMEPFAETLADAAAIYAVLRVPPHLIPSKDKSTFNNANADLQNFYGETIIPWANRYAEAFTEWFNVKEQRRYIWADFSGAGVLQENKKEKATTDKVNADTWKLEYMAGIIKLNDWIVARGGKAVTGDPIYDKTILQLTPEELDWVSQRLNLKTVSNVNNETPPEDTGAEA